MWLSYGGWWRVDRQCINLYRIQTISSISHHSFIKMSIQCTYSPIAGNVAASFVRKGKIWQLTSSESLDFFFLLPFLVHTSKFDSIMDASEKRKHAAYIIQDWLNTNSTSSDFDASQKQQIERTFIPLINAFDTLTRCGQQRRLASSRMSLVSTSRMQKIKLNTAPNRRI